MCRVGCWFAGLIWCENFFASALDSAALARQNRDMNTTAAVKEIWIKSTKAGVRAFEYSFSCNRVMPVRMADAELGLATGTMVQINMSWIDACRTGSQVVYL